MAHTDKPVDPARRVAYHMEAKDGRPMGAVHSMREFYNGRRMRAQRENSHTDKPRALDQVCECIGVGGVCACVGGGR